MDDAEAKLFLPERPSLVAVLSVLTNHQHEESLVKMIAEDYDISFDYAGGNPGEWDYQAPDWGGSMHCGLCEIPNPRAAWEALATREVIPHDWVDHPRRRFQCEGSCPECVAAIERGELARASCPECKRKKTVTRYPPTLRACVTLASDPRGVLTAEALAEEVLSQKGYRVPTPIVWEVAGGGTLAVARERARTRVRKYGPKSAYAELVRTGYFMDIPPTQPDAVRLVAVESHGKARPEDIW